MSRLGWCLTNLRAGGTQEEHTERRPKRDVCDVVGRINEMVTSAANYIPRKTINAVAPSTFSVEDGENADLGTHYNFRRPT